MFSDQCQTKINRLQNQVDEEREEYYVTLERLQDENQVKSKIYVLLIQLYAIFF